MNVTDRFLNYVSFPTNSDPKCDETPSSKKQLELGYALCEEMKQIGLSNVRIDEKGYVYGELPANAPAKAKVGFIAHMDTSSAVADAPIKPRIVEYDGGDILLNEEKGIVLSEKDFPDLTAVRGHRLIVTDGTTLLGADDKAGIAEILSAVEYIIRNDLPHGKVCVGFTPDEEIGRGADFFDIEGFDADFAYTLDGGPWGEIEYECFNGALAEIKIHGRSTHPGTAKGRMRNAIKIAAEYLALLPQDECPEKTEGYEGFYHVSEFNGSCEEAAMEIILRDHDRAKLEEKKSVCAAAGETINSRYSAGTAEVIITQQYRNMREILASHMDIVEYAAEGMRKLGTEPVAVPIRGGTDGAQLTFKGLLCPNLCAGGRNFHSRMEYVSIEDMEKCAALVVEIISALVIA